MNLPNRKQLFRPSKVGPQVLGRPPHQKNQAEIAAEGPPIYSLLPSKIFLHKSLVHCMRYVISPF